MTPEEAITMLKREYLSDSELMELANHMGWNALEKQIPKKAIETWQEIYRRSKGQANTECENAILDAIEKQIPKKPILDTIFPSGVEWYLCPACKHNNIEKSDNYCHKCGQALDWSEEE